MAGVTSWWVWNADTHQSFISGLCYNSISAYIRHSDVAGRREVERFMKSWRLESAQYIHTHVHIWQYLLLFCIILHGMWSTVCYRGLWAAQCVQVSWYTHTYILVRCYYFPICRLPPVVRRFWWGLCCCAHLKWAPCVDATDTLRTLTAHNTAGGDLNLDTVVI